MTNKIWYVIIEKRGLYEEIIIGTCEVILICNGVEINICNSNENDFGKIVIEMEDETKGVVKETEAEIGNIFDIGINIIYTDKKGIKLWN